MPASGEGYLEIHFNKLENIKEIKLQGHPSSGNFTKRFNMEYSTDGENFIFFESVCCILFVSSFFVLCEAILCVMLDKYLQLYYKYTYRQGLH